jgi:hypothetical protein
VCEILTPHDPCDYLQGGTDEAIAGCVDGQLIESTGDASTRHQRVAFRSQNVDPSSDATENALTESITKAQLSTLPDLHGTSQKLGDEIGQILRNIFESHASGTARAKQIGRVEHQEPKIANRNASDVP